MAGASGHSPIGYHGDLDWYHLPQTRGQDKYIPRFPIVYRVEHSTNLWIFHCDGRQVKHLAAVSSRYKAADWRRDRAVNKKLAQQLRMVREECHDLSFSTLPCGGRALRAVHQNEKGRWVLQIIVSDADPTPE